MKFKVGDRVRFTKEMKESNHNPKVKFDNIIRKIVKISDVWSCKKIELDGLPRNIFDEFELELVDTSKFTKSDLQEGDIVTDREGCKSLYSNGNFIGKTLNIKWLTDDLKDIDGESDNDIVKVERPIKLETVFERKEEPKVREMTVEEISKELGYEVKVVKNK